MKIENLINYIIELSSNVKYLNSITKLSNIIEFEIKSNSSAIELSNPLEKFNYWIDYTFIHGYDHLLVKSYITKSIFEIYNYDIYAVYLLAFLLYAYIVKKMLVWMFCSCKSKNAGKAKINKNIIKELKLN